MKTLIYSMSLNGELSTTLASLRIISDTHKDDVFDELIMPKNGVLTEEMLAQFRDVDLVMLASSLYHFALSSQAMDSLEIVGDYLRRNNPNVAVTLFTTSAFVLDNIPHELARKWANRFGLRYIKGQSILSMDMLKEKYRADVYAWYINVKALVTAKDLRFNRPAVVRVVCTDDTPTTAELARQYLDALNAFGADARVIRMSDYNFQHCLGCQYCYTDRRCCIKDDFQQLCRDIEAGADVQLFVGMMKNGFFPTPYKRYMDRHVCIGRCPCDDETILLYAWHEAADYVAGDEELFKTWVLGFASLGGSVLIDVCKGFDQNAVNATVAVFNENVGTYRNFYGMAIRRRFADIAYEIQNIEPLDYKYFAKSGDYKPLQVGTHLSAIHSAKDARKAVEMMSLPIRMARQQLETLKADIPERRKGMMGKSIVDWAAEPPYADYEVTESDFNPA